MTTAQIREEIMKTTEEVIKLQYKIQVLSIRLETYQGKEDKLLDKIAEQATTIHELEKALLKETER